MSLIFFFVSSVERLGFYRGGVLGIHGSRGVEVGRLPFFLPGVPPT